MKRYRVTVEKEIIVEFDDESEDFKQMFEDFNTYHASVDYEEFAETIAKHLSKYGIDDPIEGVGFVKHNGDNQTIVYGGEYKEREGLVNVIVATDINGKIDFESLYVSEEKEVNNE